MVVGVKAEPLVPTTHKGVRTLAHVSLDTRHGYRRHVVGGHRVYMSWRPRSGMSFDFAVDRMAAVWPDEMNHRIKDSQGS